MIRSESQSNMFFSEGGLWDNVFPFSRQRVVLFPAA
jgi:hypothetical protein